MDLTEYAEYRPLMFSIAYRMTGSVSDAEDIVQEVFLRLARPQADQEAASPKAYLASSSPGPAAASTKAGRGSRPRAPRARS